MKPKYGWWRIHESNETTKNRPPECLASKDNKRQPQPSCAFQKCMYPHACHGEQDPYDAAADNRNETCDETEGYSNTCTDQHSQPARCRLCATCIGGSGQVRYKRSGSGTMCKLCPDISTNRILLGVGFVIMVLGSTIMIYMEITSETSDDESSDVVKKITLNFLQMVSLAGGLPLQWPAAVHIMFDSFSTLSSAGTTLMIPDCELTTMRTVEAFYLKQFVFTFSVPMIVLLCIITWTFIKCCCQKKLKLESDKIKDYTVLSIVLMLFLCYPTLVKLSLSMLKCPIIGPQPYLMAE